MKRLILCVAASLALTTAVMAQSKGRTYTTALGAKIFDGGGE